MTLTIPQITLIALNVSAVCLHIYKDGRQKSSSNFYVQAAGWLFEVYVLSTTAFFDYFSWPQGLWGILSILGLVGGAISYGKISADNKYSGPMAVLAFAILMTIYYFGGFFN